MYPRWFLVAYILVGLAGVLILWNGFQPANLNYSLAAATAILAALLGGGLGYASGLTDPTAEPQGDEDEGSAWPGLVGIAIGLVAYPSLKQQGLDAYVPIFTGFLCLSPALGLALGVTVRKSRT